MTPNPNRIDQCIEQTTPEQLETAMRAAIYARFSSELQRDESIEDQVEVCRRQIERQGWTVTKIYSDRAQSGASKFRPQYQQMIADAERKQFDILVCEALDRLGRK